MGAQAARLATSPERTNLVQVAGRTPLLPGQIRQILLRPTPS
jgi:hypothetical protein